MIISEDAEDLLNDQLTSFIFIFYYWFLRYRVSQFGFFENQKEIGQLCFYVYLSFKQFSSNSEMITSILVELVWNDP